ncbi:ATP-binding protein [Candidatus Riflebacteria bacterium]
MVAKRNNGGIPFKTFDELLKCFKEIVDIRKKVVDKKIDFGKEQELEKSQKEEGLLTDIFHSRCKLSVENLAQLKIMKRKKLDKLETEMILILLLSEMGICGHYHCISDLFSILQSRNRPYSNVYRKTVPSGSFFKKKIVYLEETSRYSGDILKIEENFIEALFENDRTCQRSKNIKKEKDIYALFHQLVFILKAKREEFGNRDSDNYKYSEEMLPFAKFHRQASNLMAQICSELKSNFSWKLSKFFNKEHLVNDYNHLSSRNESKLFIFAILIGREFGFIQHSDDLFTGNGLAEAACQKEKCYKRMLEDLTSKGHLLQSNIIQPEVGNALFFSDHQSIIEKTYFELSEKSKEVLGQAKTHLKNLIKNRKIRNAKVSLKQLVFPKKVEEMINWILVQERNKETLFSKWGIGKKFSYGKGTTALFYGSPGTGKTALAEAIAHELEKPVFIVQYSEIQNCFVGQTEKKICQTFEEARKNDAVLVWDEADAMFHDRDNTKFNWEVREVNVLLQEIERFEGVTILTTNRKPSLDKALERRISFKIEFPLPTKKVRFGIWKKSIPKKFPLDKTVKLVKVASYPLTGGEIKNVVLNAGRIALSEGKEGVKVTMEHFEKAIEMEMKSSRFKKDRKAIGFKTT